VPEPKPYGVHEWKGRMDAGERREAVVRYSVQGARAWTYDLGSQRRRVERFALEAAPGGPVKFRRGSIEPTVAVGKSLRWDLSNVVTAQQIAISLPPDTERRQTYLQALSALPPSLVFFVLGALAVGFRARRIPGPGRLAGGAALFMFGLGASAVLANYVGPVGGIIAGPLAGALLAMFVMGPRTIFAAVPAALVPAAFLSPHHTGFILLIVSLAAIAGYLAHGRRNQRFSEYRAV